VELVGLDAGRVLIRNDGAWKVVAQHVTRGPASPAWEPSQRFLNSILADKRTCWQVPSHDGSLLDITAAVVAPILDPQGNVIGVLYGDRNAQSTAGQPITEAQAMLVELLATGVATGLARLEQEQAALRARIQFEQFFTPELSRHLEKEPNLLAGKSAEVTLLFCDIRGFSRISERVGSAKTLAWISDVMEALSACVLRHRGVVVDYIGDELIAMWGAPELEPNHARLACRAALDMLAALPDVSNRWTATLAEATQVGIGINTGPAHVGNIGSSRKFKYGPLGNTVNLASRLQGATKYLLAPVLISGQTRAQLGDEFSLRRLCRARVVNIREPVEIFELAPPDQPNWSELKTAYESALDAFETKDMTTVSQAVGNLLVRFPNDGPSQNLVIRALDILRSNPEMADRVWELSQK
jgi:adenylate cyclase